MEDTSSRAKSSASSVAADFRPLHKYLDMRFADAVVLTFGQVEDLLGHALPIQAFSEKAWWGTAVAGSALSPQATAWVQANRTATVNLSARTVMFERGPEKR